VQPAEEEKRYKVAVSFPNACQGSYPVMVVSGQLGKVTIKAVLAEVQQFLVQRGSTRSVVCIIAKPREDQHPPYADLLLLRRDTTFSALNVNAVHVGLTPPIAGRNSTRARLPSLFPPCWRLSRL